MDGRARRIEPAAEKTTPDDPFEALEKTFQRRDAKALEHHKRRLNLTTFAITLGPIAVLLLAIQVLAFPEGGFAASTLIALELVVLALALALSFLQIGRSHQLWIRERLRTEVLRREGFLLRVRVGPYLHMPTNALGEKVRERLVTIDSDVNDPVVLLPLADGEENWHDALEDARHSSSLESAPNFADNLHIYLTQRTKSQRDWFSENSIVLGKRARFYENGARLILLFALVIAALHLGLINAGQGSGGFFHTVLIVLAIVAPAIGSAFVGLKSITGSYRLSRSYIFHAHALERCEKLFRRIQLQVDQQAPLDDELQFQFKRAVLETEELLSNELHLWWLIMHSEAPRASA